MQVRSRGLTADIVSVGSRINAVTFERGIIMSDSKINVIEVFDTFYNGNIKDAKESVADMTKAEFIDFLEYARSHGYKPYQVRCLV